MPDEERQNNWTTRLPGRWNHVRLARHLSRIGLVRGCDLKRLITLDLCLRRADTDKLVRSTHGAVLSIIRNCCELIFVFVALYQSAADNRVCVRLNGQHFPPQSTTTKLKCNSGSPFGVIVAVPVQFLSTV